ncbi:MAG: protein phosphatase 2C domain-containing protein [Elainellaceae cyanobacterium]
MLYCSNYTCQAPNSESSKFCQKCRTPLVKRYLWALNLEGRTSAAGEIFLNRYLYKGDRIFLDTKPGLPPEEPREISYALLPYLRLSPYQLHIPQIYGAIPIESDSDSASEIIVLEHAPIAEGVPESTQSQRLDALDAASVSEPHTSSVRRLPSLVDAWLSASAMRQLNWLWQIARLWHPLIAEQAASSVLTPDLLRVEGSIVRLLELRSDLGKPSPSLDQLGHRWMGWAKDAKPEISSFLISLCQQMIQGQIHQPEQLIDRLDQAVRIAEQSQSQQVEIVSYTDQGPSRHRNEDACYPPSGTKKTYSISDRADVSHEDAFLIVCDGIGGHQGGDVASHLAIESIKQRLEHVDFETLASDQLQLELSTSVCAANDLISQHNDAQHRRERERMGTTLVMGLMLGSELYVTHIGDSRAYWITHRGCHQITQDDDIASREVRLGYNTYRSALQHPSSGSLVQALGMGPSVSLHPTVQRFLIDEDSIFLFCSDGLSDNDRVETFWETVILPAIENQYSLADVAQQLIAIANTHNGYDNVTVGLIYYQPRQTRAIALSSDRVGQPTSASPQTRVQSSQPTQIQSPQPSAQTERQSDLPTKEPVSYAEPTQLIASTPSRRQRVAPLLLGIILLVGLGGALIYLLVPSLGHRLSSLLNPRQTSQEPVPELTPPNSDPNPTANPVSIDVGSLIQVSRSTGFDDLALDQPLQLVPHPGDRSFPATPNESASDSSSPVSPNATNALPSQSGDAADDREIRVEGTIPAGSILQVLGKQEVQEQGRWVRLKVCSIPSVTDIPDRSVSSSSNSPEPNPSTSVLLSTQLLEPGDVGWIQESQVSPLVLPDPNLTASQLGECY